jgi:hypothetical protein
MTDLLTPKYQFMVTDLVTNRVLGQLPIDGASYTKAIRGAGAFSGAIKDPNALAQSDIYRNTMPGRTGLYILRDGECVWGGILWSRNYSANSKTLELSGAEFPSYFYHRKLWRTFNTVIGGTLVVPTSGDAYVQLETGNYYNFFEGQAVKVMFTDASLSNLNGYFNILANPGRDFFYVDASERFYRLKTRKITKYDTKDSASASSATVEFVTKTSHTFQKGDLITLKGTGNARMNGTKEVKSTPNSTTFTAVVPAWAGFKKQKKKVVTLANGSYASINGSIPPGTYSVSIDVTASTYRYVKQLLEAMAIDFDGSVFPNTAIEPGTDKVLDIETYECDEDGYAILTTSTGHELAPGQRVVIRNVRKDFNGEHTVSEVVDDNTFKYFIGSNPFSESTIDIKKYTVNRKKVVNKTITYTTTAAHGLSVGDSITITGVPAEKETYTEGGKEKTATHVYDGAYLVTVVPTTTTFQVDTTIVFKNTKTVAEKVLSSGTIYSYPEVVVKTYGSFTANSDIGITFNDDDEDLDITKVPTQVRGHELLTVGEYLDRFSDSSGGFDYRVDCAYDSETNSFTRTFRFIPVLPAYESTIDIQTKIQLLGADKLVFEYPGNISEVSMSESAENAANRFFMIGNKEGLDSEASQPYSAAVSDGFDTTDFPLLDASASDDQNADIDILYLGAKRYVNEARPPVSDIGLTINGSLTPKVNEYMPGDWCTLIIDDPFIALRLASDSEARDDLLIRKINSISVQVNEGSTFPEVVTLDLVTEYEVDTGEFN